MKRHILLAGMAWLPAAAAWAAPAIQPAAESKLIAELYGKRIAAARASPDPKDNVALAREMLLAAADSANPSGLRHLLAMEVVNLTAPAGSADAARLAAEALDLADKLKPLRPIEKCRIKVQIAGRRHAFARKSGLSPRGCAPLAEDMVKAEIALARALMQEKKINQANTVLAAARNKARAYKLSDLQADAEATMEQLRAFSARLARIRTAEARLQRANETNDEETAKAARQTLGLIFLLTDGDIPKAHSYFTGTGHQYESPVAAAVEFLKDPKKILPAEACNEAVESLAKAARSAKNKQAQARIATAAMNLCRAFLAGNPTGLSAAKARLLLGQVERLAGDSVADRFIHRLKANYGGLEGKIEVIRESLVRVSYDFARSKQLDDWRARRGTWKVSKSKGILVGTPQEYDWTFLTSRLRFRADKPLLFTFRASGRRSLTGVIGFQLENNPEQQRHWLHFQLGARNNHVSFLYDGHQRVWSNERIRISRNTVYRIEIAWDGQKSLTCTVNGKVLCKHNVHYSKKDLPYTSLFVRLEACDQPAGYDDVTVEGVILEDPSKHLTRPGPTERERPRRWRPRRPPG